MVRIELLLELFPEARFIFIYRNPYEVVESFYRFLGQLIPPLQLQSSQEDVSRHQLVEMYTEMIGSYFNTKKLILKDHYIELRFEDLINDPLSELKKIYQQFNILTFEKDLPKFRTFLSQTKKHSNNRYFAGLNSGPVYQFEN